MFTVVGYTTSNSDKQANSGNDSVKQITISIILSLYLIALALKMIARRRKSMKDDDNKYILIKNNRMQIKYSNSLLSDSVQEQSSSNLPVDFNALNYESHRDTTTSLLDDPDIDIKPVSLFNIKSRKTKHILKKPLCVLLIDTGARYSIIKPEYAHHGRVQREGLMTFQTQSGTFTSNRKTEL